MTDKFTQNCYAWFNGGVETIEPRNYFPCGTVNSTSDFLTCCMEFDTCVGNNICKASAGMTEGSEYYLGYCNDPTYTASVCPKECVDLETNGGGAIGIVYNSTTSEWNCCNDTACKSLSSEVFDAPAPSSLSVIASPTSRPYSTFTTSSASSSSTSSSLAITTTSSASSSSSTIESSTTTTTPPSSSSPPSPSSSKLPPGATAGIAIGAAIFIALLALLTYFLLRKRKSGKNHNPKAGEAYAKPELAGEPANRAERSSELAGERRVEMGGGEVPEMGEGRSQVWELQGGERGRVELG
ncbi:uncharacterized protein EAF02_001425 [Botrytis sinoallii]|uniref:uncharacterized protein n=1 Tax=Botrytis sinoallii TaxID=1463999 RepID=UPI0018FF21CB|nr:uncharacterized protein EAF02_001425 [Botrytis sinoallii]KAF7891100.1 hypothetical protein EAF02_001425 [Botrytis sinoallii]